MNEIKFAFPDGKMKAVTLSYDDGVVDDIKLIDILNKYNLKGTFNLNSGIKGGDFWVCNHKKIIRLDLNKSVHLYDGHEVAVHTLTHPDLVKLSEAEIKEEVLEDKNKLEEIFGYEVRGMAYPYGTYDHKVMDVINKCGIKYSRTVEDTENFTLPSEFLKWKPTCRHKNKKLMDIANKFIEEDENEMKLFYLWGHSYEFYVDDNWQVIEDFAKAISNKENIWYGTNIEICEYIEAIRNVVIDYENGTIENKSKQNVYFYYGNKLIMLESFRIMKDEPYHK